MSKSPATVQTTSNSTQSVPQYISDAQQGLFGYANNQLAPFLSSNPNYAVAGTNTDQQTGYDLARQLAQGAFTSSPSMPNWYGSNTGAGMTPGANTYAAATAGTPATYTPANTGGAATYDPRIAGNAQNYTAAQAGNANTYGAASTQAARLGGSDYAEFMNPYIQGVIDPAVNNLRRQSDVNAAQIAAQGAAAGSRGGSAEALRQGQNTRALGEQTSQMVSQLMSAGYDRATALAQANAQMQQQANLSNQAAENTARQTNTGAQNQFRLTDTAARNTADQFNAGANDTMARSNAGMINDAARFGATAVNADRQVNAGYADTAARFGATAQNQGSQFDAGLMNQAGQFNATSQNSRDQFLASLGLQGRAQDLSASQLQNSLMNDEQTRRYQAIQAILGIGNAQQTQLQNILNVPNSALAKLQGLTPGTVPVNTATTGTAPNTQKSLFEQLLGAGISLGGAALLPCDIRLKRDIQPYGLSEAGRPLFAFRYAWDDDDAPFTIGPMAQIEEENDPDSVVEALGIKLVKVH